MVEVWCGLPREERVVRREKKCEETRGGKRQTRTPSQRRLARAAALVLLLLVAAASASEANPPRCFNPKAPYAKFGEPTDKKMKQTVSLGVQVAYRYAAKRYAPTTRREKVNHTYCH